MVFREQPICLAMGHASQWPTTKRYCRGTANRKCQGKPVPHPEVGGVYGSRSTPAKLSVDKGKSPYERSYGETPRPRVMRCNIYLHYVIYLWGRQWRRRAAKGGMIAVR